MNCPYYARNVTLFVAVWIVLVCNRIFKLYNKYC